RVRLPRLVTQLEAALERALTVVDGRVRTADEPIRRHVDGVHLAVVGLVDDAELERAGTDEGCMGRTALGDRPRETNPAAEDAELPDRPAVAVGRGEPAEREREHD